MLKTLYEPVIKHIPSISRDLFPRLTIVSGRYTEYAPTNQHLFCVADIGEKHSYGSFAIVAESKAKPGVTLIGIQAIVIIIGST